MISGSPPCWETSITHQYNVRPPSYKLVNKSPSNYSYLCTINHSYWSYLNQLRYLGGHTSVLNHIFCSHIEPSEPQEAPPSHKAPVYWLHLCRAVQRKRCVHSNRIDHWEAEDLRATDLTHFFLQKSSQKEWTYCGWKKPCTTLDGWNPSNNGINHISTGAGFLPSTVSYAWDMGLRT